MNTVYSGTMFEGEARFYIGDMTDLIEEINTMTKYSATAIAALGRSTMITAIIGLSLKNDSDKLSTVIHGGGDIGSITATANKKGEVKSKVSNPLSDVDEKYKGKLNVGKLVGNSGYLLVSKDLGLKEPFVSQTELITGEISEDYAYYFSKSEQIPTALAAGVLVSPNYSILKAGCFFVQVLPDANENTINKLELFFQKFSSITDALKEVSPLEFMDKHFKGDYNVLNKQEIKFNCPCSQEKFENGIRLLPKEEIKELKEDESIECVCDFCFKKYDIKTKDL